MTTSRTFHRPAAAASPRRGDRTATLTSSATAAVAFVERRLGRELVVFGAIGVVSTAAYAGLYVGLRTLTGPTVANALALVLTAVANTAANRRLTFGVRGGGSMLRDQAGGLAALGVALAITTVAASLLAAVAPGAGRLVELVVLVVANALATLARFVLLRSWIARDRRRALAHAPSTDHQE